MILVMVAHPDDEILGMGGTIAKLLINDEQIKICFFSTGMTSRGDVDNDSVKLLQKNAIDANKVIGISHNDLIFRNFPDNKMDTVPLLDVVKEVEDLIDTFNPDTVFTHHHNDLNIDHKVVLNAVVTACRPIDKCISLYSSFTPSVTEWSYPFVFRPNYFVDVTSTYRKKLEAMQLYVSEIRKEPHPRCIETIDAYMTIWGSIVGCKRAEAFELIRCKR